MSDGEAMASPNTLAANERQLSRIGAYAQHEARKVGPNGQPLYTQVTVDKRGNILRRLVVPQQSKRGRD
jgi:hypothetical protein